MPQLAADPILSLNTEKTAKHNAPVANSLPAISYISLRNNLERIPLMSTNGKHFGPIVDQHQLFCQIDRMVPPNTRTDSLAGSGQPSTLPSVLIACKAPPLTKPLVIIKKEEPPKLPPNLFSETSYLPYTWNLKQFNEGELELETASSPPVDSKSFILLKDSIFDVYYHPPGSLDVVSPPPPATHTVSSVFAPFYVYPGPAALKCASDRQTLSNVSHSPPMPFQPGSPPMFEGSPVHAPASTCPRAVFPYTITIPDWSSPPLSMTAMKSSDSFGLPKDMLAELEGLEALAARVNCMKWTGNVYDSSHEEDVMGQSSLASRKEPVSVFPRGSGHRRNVEVYVSRQSQLLEGMGLTGHIMTGDTQSWMQRYSS